MKHLGRTMIPAEARGRSERMFETHQGVYPTSWRTTMEETNGYLKEHCRSEFNKESARPARKEGATFIQNIGQSIEEILCGQ